MITYPDNPTLLLDEGRCRRNIQRMVEKAARIGLPLRPHFKTHQSREVGRWFREAGISAITVSSLDMAEYFASDHWQDITLAFPLNIRQIDRVNRLAEKIRFTVTLEDEAHLECLETSLASPLSVFLKVDCGSHRTGLAATDRPRLLALSRRCREHSLVTFRGILAHAGHTYRARSPEEIREVHLESLDQLSEALARVREVDPEAGLSYGDTPSCSTQEFFGPATELRPGNFVFYDLTQTAIGSCRRSDIALALAAPVVARHRDRREVVLHGGAVHLAKDHLVLPDGTTSFGSAVPLNDSGWDPDQPLGFVRKLSQEHGIVRLNEESWSRVAIGDMLGILPVHSCHAARAMGGYRTLSGRSISMMPATGVQHSADQTLRREETG